MNLPCGEALKQLQRQIERQIINLTNSSQGGTNYDQPAGDPGLFGPGSVCWKVHGDFPVMICGGISALMLQMMHPLALAGVWDHSNFRADMLGRLRRTSQFVGGTTFGPTAAAKQLINKVQRIHDQVQGIAPDGRPYSANDPALLRWVHVAEHYGFLSSYLRYGPEELSLAEQDQYFDEVALIAEALGATQVPRSRPAVERYLQEMQPELVYDERTAEVMSLLLAAPTPNWMTKPAGYLVTQAAVDLLPDWARAMAGLKQSWPKQQAIRWAMQGLAQVLRSSVRNGASQRAKRRVGELG